MEERPYVDKCEMRLSGLGGKRLVDAGSYGLRPIRVRGLFRPFKNVLTAVCNCVLVAGKRFQLSRSDPGLTFVTRSSASPKTLITCTFALSCVLVLDKFYGAPSHIQLRFILFYPAFHFRFKRQNE